MRSHVNVPQWSFLQNPQDFGLHQPTLADYQIQHDVIPDRTSAGVSTSLT
ncbi:hypothetical protein T265_06406 [Opisthorchis viverrini]|uniref:Uncharacterized protein n=1 Tax=Opisthorchis viverrini TaxID=6198 RepID=A0A074ZGE5_OPIVI|nr:hypothetical protein T265_06406 [Opisthorchis viverrini]KER26361.1 hypothetical protein T265_06406 [Opisthorchis viverrini]